MTNKGDVQYIISSEESERIQILKIWFTIMVIFIHSYTEKVHFTEGDLILEVPVLIGWIKYIISQVISSCAVPGFFFISAVFLYRKTFTWKENIEKKLKSLITPYLIFNTFWILFYYFAQRIPVLQTYFTQEENIISNWGLLQFFNAYLGFKDSYPILYPLWFVRDLMVLNVMAVLIKRLIDRMPQIIFALLVLMIVLNINTHLFFLRKDALVYFCLGYYFVKYSIKFNEIDKIEPSHMVAIYVICVWLDCITRYMPIHYIFHFITEMTGIIFFYRFSTQISSGKIKTILIRISKYSFSIYLFHEMSLSILKKFLTKLIPITAFGQIFLYFGIPVIIFIFCLMLSIVLNKYFHKTYTVLVGNRKM